jgi:hypothetical protein
MVFWDVMPCSLVEGYQHSRQTCCLLYRVHSLKIEATSFSSTRHHISGGCNLDTAMRTLGLTKAIVVLIIIQLVL